MQIQGDLRNEEYILACECGFITLDKCHIDKCPYCKEDNWIYFYQYNDEEDGILT